MIFIVNIKCHNLIANAYAFTSVNSLHAMNIMAPNALYWFRLHFAIRGFKAFPSLFLISSQLFSKPFLLKTQLRSGGGYLSNQALEHDFI